MNYLELWYFISKYLETFFPFPFCYQLESTEVKSSHYHFILWNLLRFNVCLQMWHNLLYAPRIWKECVLTVFRWSDLPNLTRFCLLVVLLIIAHLWCPSVFLIRLKSAIITRYFWKLFLLKIWLYIYYNPLISYMHS